ncbi:MAG: DUF3558 domain-containing protein [Pseudonocardiales bacterium]|nr:DUF3558 domain-containing protein [Pseudonocardiales bacterium]MBV9032675.1 DUF3558 domain-containing protein [Pseudonocardiales bacterium]MBW0010744.1 DUF3558 domain-containing protein [Pseudonocardiales bacterium]
MVILALLAAGCGSPSPGSGPSPAVADASRVDMCTILTDTQLTALGLDVNTRKPFDKVGVVGCGWQGKSLTLGLERDRETVASYKARQHDPAFTSFADNTVNGRAGAHLSVDRERDDCTQLVDGGLVSLVVSVAPAFSLSGPSVDSCAEALRIAQMIEPRLPKAGS